jgi:hypothetical protein
MTIEQMEKVQNVVAVGLPIITTLEEVIMIAIEIDRADGGQLEIRLLQFQMTVMTTKLILVETNEGLNDYGPEWLTDERAETVIEAIQDVNTITGEIEPDDPMDNLIEAAHATYEEKMNA